MKLSKHLEIAKKQLKTFSDSYFSTLILGERGIGKSFLLGEIGGVCINTDSLKNELEKNNNNQKLVIDLIENLTIAEQKEIFHLISTGQKNSLLNIKGNPTCPQLIFTSQLTLSKLYNSDAFYKPFIDRIVQQVVKLQSIRELDVDGCQCAWDSVNENMLFDENQGYLDWRKKFSKEIVFYIKKELSLGGNFRDLEKLSILLWRNYETHKESAKALLDEFKETHETEIPGDFFKVNRTADAMIKDFRRALVDWAEKKYQDSTRAELITKLEISEKTYYNWKNGL